MNKFAKTLLLALTFATWAPNVNAILPMIDSVLGVVQERPLCPARPASPEFQRAALYEFVNEFFFEENGIVSAFENFISPDYIQHNPAILSGRNNTLTLLESGSFVTGVNITILKVMFDSPYGMIHYKWQQGNETPTAYVDMWRFNGTCIQEHWDVIETLPANATNPIALF
jgi:predicted SnoaL-like aldol condensation-catalyzing enzyme